MLPASTTPKRFADRVWRFYFLAIGVGMLALLPRFTRIKDAPFGQYLWAEDGLVFMGHDQAMGIAAFLDTYAGYFHFYPRLTAFVAGHLDLVHRPVVYFAGWLLAYAILIVAITRAARSGGLGAFSTLVLLLLVGFQPTVGDVLFTITNAQWILGSALMLFVLVDGHPQARFAPAKGLGMLGVSLTGPFSVVATPLVLVKAFLKRDARVHAWVYGAVLLGASIQLMIIARTGRATYLSSSSNPWEFIVAFMQLLLFSADSFPEVFAAMVFWVALVIAVVRLPRSDRLTPLLLLAAILMTLLVVLYSVRNSPLAAVTLGGGNRFTWIPYTLAFTTAFLAAAHQPVLRWIMVLSAAFICVQNFHVPSYGNYQFPSFARLAKVKPIAIPINPAGLYVIDGSPFVLSPDGHRGEMSFDFSDLTLSGMKETSTPDGRMLVSESRDPMVVFNQPLVCPGVKHAAVEIEMERNAAGPIEFFWNSAPGFIQKRSMERWYPEGVITAQFAFPTRGKDSFFRLDPMREPGWVRLIAVRTYCLD